jgi:hypothetical protein
MTRSNYETATDVTTVEVRAGERIRWGAIMAGLFAALSTLVVLSVLGAAVGLSAYDPGDSARNFSIGVGIWSAISMIIAFLLGGYVAGRWGAPYRDTSALVHGAMVWAVAIPLSLFVLGSIGTLLGSSAIEGGMANRGTNTGQVGGDQFDTARPAGAQLGAAAGERTADDPQEHAQRRASGAAWGTLISLLLGLGAAALGGRMGATGDRDYGATRTTGTTTGTTGTTGTGSSF